MARMGLMCREVWMMGSRYVGGEVVTQMLAWDKRSEDGFLR